MIGTRDVLWLFVEILCTISMVLHFKVLFSDAFGRGCM